MDTSGLKQQFASSQEPIGQAVGTDAQGLAGLDFTNPANMMNVLHHGIPMALQMAATMAMGPEANPLMKMLGSAVGSVGGGLYQSAAEPMMKGQPVTTTPTGMAADALLGAGAEGATQLGGGAVRGLTGKSGMLSEGLAAEQEAGAKLEQARQNAMITQGEKLADVGAAAEAKATEGQQAFDTARTGAEMDQKAKLAETAQTAGAKAAEEQAAAQAKVQTSQEAVDRLKLKYESDALKNTSEDAVAKQVQTALQPTQSLENPTIESLSERNMPALQSAQRSITGSFKELGDRFTNFLDPIRDTPIPEASFANAIDAERATLTEAKEVVGKKLTGIMDDLSSMDSKAPLNVSALPPNLQQERTMLLRSNRMTPEAVDEHIKLLASGLQGPQAAKAASALSPVTVDRLDNVRKKLTGIVIDSASPPLEKRVAANLMDVVDKNLGTVLPPEQQAAWTSLRNDWHEAKNVFSPTMRSTLFRAKYPWQVAKVLVGTSGEDADRALMVINKTPDNEKPLLRSAFADLMTQGDVVKNVENQDPRIFKALFNGTGFEDPKAWVADIRSKIDYAHIAQNPELQAQYNARLQEGMKSLGMRKYRDALAAAETMLKQTKNPGDAITEAMKGELTPSQAGDVAMRGQVRPDAGQARAAAVGAELTPTQAADYSTAKMEKPAEAKVRGEMEGMKTPMIGSKMTTWLQHHMAFKTAMSLTAMASLAGYHSFGHPLAFALPLIYLSGSRMAANALANPVRAQMWHNMLKSKNAEQAAFMMGRFIASGLTETVRSSK